MKHKRIIALIMAASIILSGFSLTGEIGDFRRSIEGYCEIVSRVIRSWFETRNYDAYEELAEIPEVENGYVPQGYCFDGNKHYISYYHSEKASIIAVVDAESGNRIKTLNLKRNGKDFKGHVGGIASDSEYFYVCHGSSIYRLALVDLHELDDGSSVELVNKISTDVKCSYLNCDGKYLYAGEFYTFTTEGSYDTDKSHHMAISLFETTYSRCNAYLLSDIEDAFYASNDENVVPEMIFTTPNCVQGLARMPDGKFALSTSYGRNNDSFLKIYSDVTKGECDFTVDFSGVTVPVYHLKNSVKIQTFRQPPLLEGIDDMNGKVSGIFESCADKYSDSAFIVENICAFS